VEFETARTVVYPWQCDLMGHLATQNYMRIFDDATYHLLARVGCLLSRMQSTGLGWADVSHHIAYRKELLPGDLLVAMSSIVGLGRRSLKYRTRLLRSAGDCAECAVLTGVAVHFDLENRIAIDLPPELRARAQALLDETPQPAPSGMENEPARKLPEMPPNCSGLLVMQPS
jgi:acyl-CoA thioester hydrolase